MEYVFKVVLQMSINFPVNKIFYGSWAAYLESLFLN